MSPKIKYASTSRTGRRITIVLLLAMRERGQTVRCENGSKRLRLR